MKLSISNIAWGKEADKEMYEYIMNAKFDAIEIAPTRIIEENPYENIDDAEKFAIELESNYNLKISSMQSIWYGKQGNIFNPNEAENFINYTKKAIDFANRIGCKNLVFGCPKNRMIPEGRQEDDVLYFFKQLGEYANEKQTVLAIEPNPTIYGTNFINYTNQAFEFVKKVDSDGVKVNVDFGTIVQNNEELNGIFENIDLVNHIHISEPNLAKIENRESHKVLCENLERLKYNRYISIEMKNTGDLNIVKDVIKYVNGIFK